MSLRTRRDYYGLDTQIDTTQLCRASKLVSGITGMLVQPNKAIVGANAFAHEAGIHQDGMLKHEETYEIMRPADVGAGRTKLVLGKHSGKAAVAARLRELGLELSKTELRVAMDRFKALAERKKTVTDTDLEALVSSDIRQPVELWKLTALQVTCGTKDLATATVCLRDPDGNARVEAGVGTGPVDAAFKAIERVTDIADALGESPELLDYTVRSVTEGIDAVGEVTVQVRAESRPTVVHPQSGALSPQIVHGHGADTDVVVASARAYLSALNRLLSARKPSVEPSAARKGA